MSIKPKTAAITIRKLDPKLVAALKARAESAGRSMEEEARTILERSFQQDRVAVVERFRSLRESIDPGNWDSVRMVQEARAERDAYVDENLDIARRRPRKK